MFTQNSFDLDYYCRLFIKHLRRLNYSTETIKGYTKDLKKFKQYLHTEYSGNILTKEIQKEDLQDFLSFLEQNNLKPNSICRNLSTLKSLYKFLVNEMNFDIDVAAKLKQPKVYTPLPNILDFSEMQAFLDASKRNSLFYYTMFSLLYYTGSRLSPIRLLLKDNVDLRNKQIYFPKIKNGKDLYLPLNERMYEILSQYMSDYRHNGSDYVFHSPKSLNSPVSPSEIRLKMKAIAKTANIDKHLTPHIIRHCTATHLTILGAEQKYIASILGHSDLRSTARYQQLNVENLRSTINKLR